MSSILDMQHRFVCKSYIRGWGKANKSIERGVGTEPGAINACQMKKLITAVNEQSSKQDDNDADGNNKNTL